MKFGIISQKTDLTLNLKNDFQGNKNHHVFLDLARTKMDDSEGFQSVLVERCGGSFNPSGNVKKIQSTKPGYLY